MAMDGYHHDVAVNQWRARRPRDFESAGLLRYGLRLDTEEGELEDPLGTTCVCIDQFSKV